MESQPQNPDSRNNLENFHHVGLLVLLLYIPVMAGWLAHLTTFFPGQAGSSS